MDQCSGLQDHPAKTIHHLRPHCSQAFQSWNEICGEARPKPSVLPVAFNQGGKQWKPHCAKSPPISATDRFQTSYSGHPSTSFATVLPSFVTTSLCLLFIYTSEMGESVYLHFACFVRFAKWRTYSSYSVCSVCSVCNVCCAKPHYGSFRIPGGTVGTGSARQQD